MTLPRLTGALAPVANNRPWPRYAVTEAHWREAGVALADGRLTLLGLWGEASHTHLALFDEAARGIAVLSLDCASGVYPSIGALHPPAIASSAIARERAKSESGT